MPYVFLTALGPGPGVNAYGRPVRGPGLLQTGALTTDELGNSGDEFRSFTWRRLLTDLHHYCWVLGFRLGHLEVRVGLKPFVPVLCQARKTQWSRKSDRVTYMARVTAAEKQDVRDPRLIRIPKHPRDVCILGYSGEGPGNVQERRTGTPRQESKVNITGDQEDGKRKRHRQQQGPRGIRHFVVHHLHLSRIFDSTLGYPGEGPEGAGTRTRGRQQQASRHQSTLPPNTPPPNDPYPGVVHQQPREMGTLLGHLNARRVRHKRGRYYKKKRAWPQGAVASWKKRDRDGVWRKYIRSTRPDLAIPTWCVQRLHKLFPGESVARARQKWIRKNPKRRRTYRGGRQARARRGVTQIGTSHTEVSTMHINQTVGHAERTSDTRVNQIVGHAEVMSLRVNQAVGHVDVNDNTVARNTAVDSLSTNVVRLDRTNNTIPYSCRGTANAEPHAVEGPSLNPNTITPCQERDNDVNAQGSSTLLEDTMAGRLQGVQILPPNQGGVAQYRQTRRPSKRLWVNRLKLKWKRKKARNRRKARRHDRKTGLKPRKRKRGANTPVLVLTGAKGDSRMSFTHRIRVPEVTTHVVTEIKMVFVNVRTMREKRAVSMRGRLRKSGTKNNWKIVSLKRMMQQHGIYLTALSETRMPTKELDVGDGYILLTSQNMAVPWRGGVGILLSPAAVEAWRAAGSLTWYPKAGSKASGRYLEVTLATAVKSEGTFTVASVYGPTMQTVMEYREAFYDTCRSRVLEPRTFRGRTSVARRLSSRQFLLMMGDMNARVGRLTREDEGNTKVLGLHNLSAVNANGSLLTEMATACRMCVANTFFKHTPANTTTWMSCANRIPRVIDHALVRQWSMRHVVDVRAAPSLQGYVHTDHTPCVITLRGNPRRSARARLRSSNRWRMPKLPTRLKRLDTTPLCDQQFKGSKEGEAPNEVDMVVEKMEAKLENVEDLDALDFDTWLREVAEEVLKPQPRNPTWTASHRETIAAAVDRRAGAAAVLVRMRGSDDEEKALRSWKQADRALRKCTTNAMNDHMQGILNDAATVADGKKLPREFFRHVGRVKRFIGCYERPAKLLLRNPVRRIQEQDDWFKKRFNIICESISEEEILSIPPLDVPGIEEIFVAPEEAETFKAVMALRNGKSPDINGVQAEVLKAAVQSRIVLRKLHNMISEIWKGGKPFPSHWLKSIGCTIWKGKQPKDDLDNWRMINIIVITSKVVTKMMHWRLQKLGAATWSYTQYGFKKEAWTMDAIYVIKRLMEVFRTTRSVRRGSRFEQYNRTLYIMFEDFVKAFDSVNRELLWKELRQIYGVPESFVELLKKFHDGFWTYTAVNGMYGEGFLTRSGLRQGCINGPDLWGCHIQVVMLAVARRMLIRRIIIPHGIKTHCYLDGRLRTLHECTGMTPYVGIVKDATFADDAALVAHGIQQTGVFLEFDKAASAAGLTMSQTDPITRKPGKTKVMRITGGTTSWRPRDRNEERINAGGEPLPFVEEFLHLGQIQSTDRDLGVKADISRRLKKGISAHAALDVMWKGKCTSYVSKGQLTAAITIPTALYGCENWALTRPNIRRLERFWNRITRWTYGVRTHKFQDLGKRHTEIRKILGVQEIMTYVRRRVLSQIGHIVRKPIQDPSKQLLLGSVAERVTVRRTREGGRTGNKTQPPKLLNTYYRNTLEEQAFPGFDMRIWALLAQDRSWWRAFSQAATSTTGFGGPNVEALSTRASAVRKQRRIANGAITVKVNENGDTEEWETCPLRCGFRGRVSQIAKHVADKHPLHPVQHYCSACGFPNAGDGKVRKSLVKAHVEQRHEEGESEMRVRVLPQYVYRWDKKAGYLRTYPPGTLPHDNRATPFPEGWLSSRGEVGDGMLSAPDGGNDQREHTDPAIPQCEGIIAWDGKSAQEKAERLRRRADILRGRQLTELTERERRTWMRTQAYTRSDDGHMGWGAKGKLTRAKQRRAQRVGQRRGCRGGCEWNDHDNYTKYTCPLHPEYQGKKPRVKGDTEEAERWRQEQRRVETLIARRTRELQNQRSIPCRRGCGRMFHTRKQREVHMRNCIADGVRVRNQCPVPGCAFEHADKAIFNRHTRSCWKTYEWKSPTCMACGICYTNQEYNPQTERFELRDYRAKAYWNRHANLYKQARQVDCQRCGAPHLMPWCAITPKQHGRHFMCSDNYFDPSMGSQECRRIRPADSLPQWVRPPTSPQHSDHSAEDDSGSSTSSEGELRLLTATSSSDGGGSNVYSATTESSTDDEGSSTGRDTTSSLALPDSPAQPPTSASIDHPSISAWATLQTANDDASTLPDTIVLAPAAPNGTNGSVRL